VSVVWVSRNADAGATVVVTTNQIAELRVRVIVKANPWLRIWTGLTEGSLKVLGLCRGFPVRVLSQAPGGSPCGGSACTSARWLPSVT
jgi:hypothetical protein